MLFLFGGIDGCCPYLSPDIVQVEDYPAGRFTPSGHVGLQIGSG